MSSPSKKSTIFPASRCRNISLGRAKALNEKFLDKRFGRLIVLHRGKNIGDCAAWVCQCDCGNTKLIRGHCLAHGQLSCGCILRETGQEFRLKNASRGPRHPRWNGGKRITKHGYIQIRNPEGNIPYYVLEHRYKKEIQIGRALYPHETVHHLNGVRDDNRIENLELWSKSQPPGQRVSDKVKWAKELLSLYERIIP